MAVVETVPTDGLVKRLTESWPPRSPAETRKNVPMPGSPARKPPIAIKSAAVKDMTKVIDKWSDVSAKPAKPPKPSGSPKPPRSPKPSRSPKPQKSPKPVRSTKPPISSSNGHPTASAKKPSNAATSPTETFGVNPNDIARAAMIRQRRVSDVDLLAKMSESETKRLRGNVAAKDTNTPERPRILSSSADNSQLSGIRPSPSPRTASNARGILADRMEVSPSPVSATSSSSSSSSRGFAIRFRRCKLADVDVSSPPVIPMTTKPSLPPTPAQFQHLVVPGPGSVASEHSQADSSVGVSADVYEDLEVVKRSLPSTRESAIGNGDLYEATENIDNGDLYEATEDMDFSMTRGKSVEVDSRGNGSTIQSTERSTMLRRTESAEAKLSKAEEKQRKKEEERLRKKEEKRQREEEKLREAERLKEERRAKEEEKRRKKELEKEKKKAKSSKSSSPLPTISNANRSPSPVYDASEGGANDADDLVYGEVEDFGEGLEDIDFSTMASATSLEGRTMGRSISSTSIKIGPGKEVTELRLRSATICAAAMQHMKRPGLKRRTTDEGSGGIAVAVGATQDSSKPQSDNEEVLYELAIESQGNDDREPVSADANVEDLYAIAEHDATAKYMQLQPTVNVRNASMGRLSVPKAASHNRNSYDSAMASSMSSDNVFDNARSGSVSTQASHDSWNQKISSAYIAWAGESCPEEAEDFLYDETFPGPIPPPSPIPSPSPIPEEQSINRRDDASPHPAELAPISLPISVTPNGEEGHTVSVMKKEATRTKKMALKEAKEEEKRRKIEHKKAKEDAKRREREEKERKKLEEKAAKERERQEKLKLAKDKKLAKKMTKAGASSSSIGVASIVSESSGAAMVSDDSGSCSSKPHSVLVSPQLGDSIESLSKTLVPANDPKPQDGGGDTSTTEHEETDQGIVSDDCTPVHSDAIRGGGTDTEEDAYDNAPPRPLGTQSTPVSALKTPGRPDEATLTVFPPEQPDFVNRCEYGDALNQGQEAEQSSARQLQAPVGVQRRASTELKSQLFSAMGALDGIAGVDTRNYRLSCSIVLDGDGVDMTSPAADAAKQYGHHDLSESLIVHTGFGDDSQIGAGSLLKYDESNVYDVPEIQEPCSAHSTLPRGIDTSYDDCSGHATPSFSPRVSPLIDDENLYDEVTRSTSTSPVPPAEEDGHKSGHGQPEVGENHGGEPVVLLGPHGRPLSTINEEAASQGSPGVNRRAAAPRSNLLEPSSLVKAINQTSNGGERKPKRSLFKRSGTKDSDLLQVAEDHAANSKPKKKISTKEEKEAQRAAKKHHNELMKHINSQKKLFKLSGNEEVIVVVTARDTCTSGPENFLLYNSGEEFDVLIVESTPRRELPEDSWLARRKLDGTYGYIEEVNMVLPNDIYEGQPEDQGFAEVGIDIGGLEPTVVKTIELIDSGDGTTGARVHVYDKVCRELITTEREVAWQQMQRDPDEIPPPAVPPPGAPAAGREGS